MSGSSKHEVMDSEDLCRILRRQLDERDARRMQPEFQRILAEEIATSMIGEFYYGELLLSRDEDHNLSAEAERIHLDPQASIYRSYMKAVGPTETMDSPCQCADLTHLTVQGVHLSGSTLEGSDVRLNGFPPDEFSDIDVMLQLGSVEFLDREATGASSSSQRNGGVTVIPESVHQKGFFLLYHTHLPSCQHSDRKLFSGRRLRKKILHIVVMNSLEQGKSSVFHFRGPSIGGNDGGCSADLVTCIGFPSWPSAEFTSRQRPSHHPNPALVSRLSRTPALLVPVGSSESPTEEHEWRISFSRHEFLAHRAMPRILRDCLAVLKNANALINGPYAAIKGFQLKTSVLWLAERHCEKELERHGFFDCLLMALQFVQESAVSGHLGCYFWKDINLLGGRSQEELVKIESDVRLLKKHLETALRVLVTIFMWNGSGVQEERLPKRRMTSMLEFMFPATMRDPERKKGPYHSSFSPPDTWMHTNFLALFCRKFGRRHPYDKVFHKMETGEEENRERKMKAVRWTDES